MRISGTGYEGRTLDEFVKDLRNQAVTHVVDVRLNAISRKAGFSKRALAAGLEAVGIGYSHFPELGNARENRAGYAETDGVVAITARDTFRAHLASDEAQGRIHELLNLAHTESVAVFCYEAQDRRCHREQVIDAVWDARISRLVDTRA